MKIELENTLRKTHPIPEELLNQFLECWNFKKAGKNEILSNQNQTDRNLYFVTKGVQKAFYSVDGKDFNIAFSYPFGFTCVPESFLTQKPSKYTYECITESEFLVINHFDFFKFVDEHHEFETLLRKTLIGTLNGVVNRYHRVLALSMKERYLDFMKISPHLINQINHKEIANYLNIDPTNFSKLLNSIKV